MKEHMTKKQTIDLAIRTLGIRFQTAEDADAALDLEYERRFMMGEREDFLGRHMRDNKSNLL